MQFQVWDIPGQIDFFDPTFDSDMIFGGCGSLIFVIDAQVCHTDLLIVDIPGMFIRKLWQWVPAYE